MLVNRQNILEIIKTLPETIEFNRESDDLRSGQFEELLKNITTAVGKKNFIIHDNFVNKGNLIRNLISLKDFAEKEWLFIFEGQNFKWKEYFRDEDLWNFGGTSGKTVSFFCKIDKINDDKKEELLKEIFATEAMRMFVEKDFLTEKFNEESELLIETFKDTEQLDKFIEKYEILNQAGLINEELSHEKISEFLFYVLKNSAKIDKSENIKSVFENIAYDNIAVDAAKLFVKMPAKDFVEFFGSLLKLCPVQEKEKFFKDIFHQDHLVLDVLEAASYNYKDVDDKMNCEIGKCFEDIHEKRDAGGYAGNAADEWKRIKKIAKLTEGPSAAFEVIANEVLKYLIEKYEINLVGFDHDHSAQGQRERRSLDEIENFHDYSKKFEVEQASSSSSQLLSASAHKVEEVQQEVYL